MKRKYERGDVVLLGIANSNYCDNAIVIGYSGEQGYRLQRNEKDGADWEWSVPNDKFLIDKLGSVL